MATLNEYYQKDFSRLLSIHKEWMLYPPGEPQIAVTAKIHFDFDSNTFFISYYLPGPVADPIRILKNLLHRNEEAIKYTKEVSINSGLPGETSMSSLNLVFSGRIFFYYEGNLDANAFEKLQAELTPLGLHAHYRDAKFATERSKVEKPLAFISHDNRDKEIANKIAVGLEKLVCPVWYDEFSLKVGQSLRESIEKGLKECKKCVLILSSNFLDNNGWTKSEFNAIFTREIMEEKNFVLPVWVNIDKKRLFEYSPTLVDRVGVNWSSGVDVVLRKLHRAIISGE